MAPAGALLQAAVAVAPVAESAPVVPAAIVTQSMPALAFEMLDSATWTERFNEFGFGGVLGTIASHCELRARDGLRLSMVLDDQHAAFFDDSHTQRMQEHLRQTFGAQLTLAVSVGRPHSETPYQRRDRLRQERLAAARASIAADANVRLLLDGFGAQLDAASIEPVN